MNIKKIYKGLALAGMGFALMGFASCSESQSYSELLTEENHAVNWYLASQKVENNIPADSISFIVGEDAPFYKLDDDGYVYMQVISKGNMEDRVKSGDIVYFRFNKLNLKYLYLGEDPEWFGNATDLSTAMGTNEPNYTRFIYENQYLSSSTKWGTGIQMPLKFFGYDCEVNLVLRSYYGFLEDQTTCLPYLINLRYFKPEY
ncbi:MAG: DUF4827 domain-containing protein [Bacteroides sp.]|nr:DUF4827 domain-containing protein [Bacteroides sp.]